MRRTPLAASLLALALLATAASAADAPGPDHARLEFFVGRWKTTGEARESPLGPAGRFTEDATCAWFSGNYTVVCKTRGRGPAGPVEGLGIVGWSGEERIYLYYAVDASPVAQADVPRGTYADGTWTFEGDARRDGRTVRVRRVVRRTGKDAYATTWSVRGPDGKWTDVMAATSVRE
jgi:hypothetical protein